MVRGVPAQSGQQVPQLATTAAPAAQEVPVQSGQQPPQLATTVAPAALVPMAPLAELVPPAARAAALGA